MNALMHASLEQLKMAAPTQDRIFLSPPHLSRSEATFLEAALESNYIAPGGPMVKEFERELAFEMSMAHCLAVNSGTAALHLALRIAGLNPGDEVWAPTLTFIGGVSPILFENAKPVFFDCDEHGLIDLDLVEVELQRASKLGTLPKALIVTDLYGLAVDAQRAKVLCEQYGVLLISDAAEALGSRLRGLPPGQGADLSVLSFNGNKIVTTSGGGALLSNRGDLIERAHHLSTQAREPVPHYEHQEIGFNYRLSNIAAALGRGQLENLRERVLRKQAINAAYRKALGGLAGVSFLEEPSDCQSNCWLTVIFLDPNDTGIGPESLRLELEAHNIESRPVWKPMHMQPVFAHTRFVKGATAERLFARGLCLPSGTAMTDQDVDRISGILRRRLVGVR